MNSPADLLKELRIDRRGGAPKKRRRWPAILGLIVVLFVVAFFLMGRRPVEVETAKARSAAEGGPASVLDASGYVTARRIATVSSKITGKVREVMIEEGQRVVEGEILATLDPADASAQRDLSQAQLASSQSQLAEAQAQLKLAERNLVRQRELAAKKLVAAQSLDSAIAERDSRAARLVSLQRAVGVARDQLTIAGLGVDNTVIRAPFSGVIVTKAGRNDLAHFRRRWFHPYRHRHAGGHGFAGSAGGRERGLHRPRAAEDAGGGGVERLSRMEDPR